MAEYQSQLARIQAKITTLKEKDVDLNLFGSESHAYKLNQPLSNQTIAAFENEHQIALPQGLFSGTNQLQFRRHFLYFFFIMKCCARSEWVSASTVFFG